jgi:hypothetical protein
LGAPAKRFVALTHAKLPGGASQVTVTDKVRGPEEQGAWPCPIFENASPHHHSPEEQKQRSEPEAWIEEIWQEFCESMMPCRPI